MSLIKKPNKLVRNDRELREHIEKTTKMIPASPGTPENKAVIEGEFGKFEQAVGTLFFGGRQGSLVELPESRLIVW